jgi:hypothetical protein
MFPILSVVVSNPRSLVRSADVIGYLDSGAQRSLFDGTLAGFIGLDLMDGLRVTFASAAGLSIEGIIHPVRLSHPELGKFDLDIAFSTVPAQPARAGFSTWCRSGFGRHRSSREN